MTNVRPLVDILLASSVLALPTGIDNLEPGWFCWNSTFRSEAMVFGSGMCRTWDIAAGGAMVLKAVIIIWTIVGRSSGVLFSSSLGRTMQEGNATCLKDASEVNYWKPWWRPVNVEEGKRA